MSSLRSGLTTGTCAAAAAKAAAILLSRHSACGEVTITLPDGRWVAVPVLYVKRTAFGAEAAVVKDASDDPDITNGAAVVVSVAWANGEDVELAAGEGVGTVTRPGLSVPPGEPAINPVPRKMIRQAVREVTDRGVRVTISIPGGRELAEKTFNPRLGVVGGLSILGTTGIVRPFSCTALREALKCSLDVAAACGVTAPVFVPGHIGERAARMHFRFTQEQVIEVSNEWGFMLECFTRYRFQRLLVVGHPGKLAKLSMGWWDTHSARSESPIPAVIALGSRIIGSELPAASTVEGVFADLPGEQRRLVGDALARGVLRAVAEKIEMKADVSVVLVNMQCEIIGCDGDLTPWQ